MIYIVGVYGVGLSLYSPEDGCIYNIYRHRSISRNQPWKSADHITHRSRRRLKRAKMPPHRLRWSETGELSLQSWRLGQLGNVRKDWKIPLFSTSTRNLGSSRRFIY